MTQGNHPIVSHEMHADMRACFSHETLTRLMLAFDMAITEELKALETAEAGSLTVIADHSHRMASAASQYGFPELAAVAKMIEARAELGHPSALNAEALKRLKGAVARALAASEALRNPVTANC